jgi:hypothetical protein
MIKTRTEHIMNNMLAATALQPVCNGENFRLAGIRFSLPALTVSVQKGLPTRSAGKELSR